MNDSKNSLIYTINSKTKIIILEIDQIGIIMK